MKYDTTRRIVPTPIAPAAGGVDSYGRRKTARNAFGVRLAQVSAGPKANQSEAQLFPRSGERVGRRRAVVVLFRGKRLLDRGPAFNNGPRGSAGRY